MGVPKLSRARRTTNWAQKSTTRMQRSIENGPDDEYNFHATAVTTTVTTTALRSHNFILEAIPVGENAASVLWEFLRIAAHEDTIETVQSNPNLARYVADYNPHQDFGFIARIGPEPVGAIWTRLWNKDPTASTSTTSTTSSTTSRRRTNRGFAFVSETIPELALAVKTEYQQRGIGAALLQRLLDEASSRRTLPGVSLSVRDTNTVALRMYQNAGFQHVWSSPNRTGSQSYAMIKLLDERTVIPRSELSKNDIPTIVSLIHKKADFDRTMADSITTLTVTDEKLEVALFRDKRAHAILAEQQGNAVGMALYYFRFSSFAGQPSLWLEDLFVEDDHRSQGVGRMLMEHLAVVATTHNCTHIGWTASERNARGLAFYQRLGATIVHKNGTTCTLKWIINNND